MRFYELTYQLKLVDKISGETTISDLNREWYGSEREAVVRRLELFKAGGWVMWPIAAISNSR